MDPIVGVVKGEDKHASFDKLLEITGFNTALVEAYQNAKKPKQDFRIVIKPNMMVFVSHEAEQAVVTDPELVEQLVDHIISLGFSNITLCEAQHDVGRMFKNHNVQFVSEQIGYKPDGRYRIADLTLEKETYPYTYLDKNGKVKKWKDTVGRTWRDADFRISFAKCKTHEHDYMTLAVKNIYGCFPNPSKVCRYHIKHEVEDVTARSLRNFMVHFALVDGWIASDGFQGYKIGHPQPLNMLFGGPDAIAVDMEIFKRAGVDWRRSQILDKCIQQVNGGIPPEYQVTGDTKTRFEDLTDWQNIKPETVRDIDIFEEVYISWGVINMTPAAKHFDYSLFPPKNILSKIAVWITKKMYALLKGTSLIKKWYRRRLNPEEMKKIEDGEFDSTAILAIIWASLKKLVDKAAIIMWTSILLLMIWGLHGNMDILHGILDKPFGPDWTQKITFGLAWGEQLMSFIVGFLMAVVIPCLIIKIRFKENLKEYGLGLPRKEDRRKAWVAFGSLFGFTALFVMGASFNGAMQDEYPLFGDAITTWEGFLIYELVYLLFFISIEFAFRGYLLFGLHRIKIKEHTDPPVLRFGVYAILIQMLAYTTWHYGKPPLEMGGTIIWGIAVAAIALRIRSLWPIIIAHWLYNVLLDLLIWKEIPQKLSGQ